MRFSHCEEHRGDRHLDILTDEENGLRIIVSRLGAELISLARINEAGEVASFIGITMCQRRPGMGKSRHSDGLFCIG
jgi:hypothetical protein